MGCRVLLVDDNPDLLSVLFDFVKARGLAVKEIAYSSETLEAIISSLTAYHFDEISVDFFDGTLVRNGTVIELSTTESRLLRYLISRRGIVVSRKTLLTEVWAYRATNTRTVDVHISGLRQKIEESPSRPRHILTIRGQGYVFRD